METTIIVSKKDPAGMNIASFLEREDLNSLNTEIHFLDEDTIYSNDLDKKINADLFIFATRHQSAKGVHSLSCHCPGNWGKAEAGGEDGKLCVAPAVYLKEIFLLLNKTNNMEFEVTMECTHHGPYMEKPCFFIEIGSDEEQWKSKQAGKIISKVIIEFLNKRENFCKAKINSLVHKVILYKQLKNNDFGKYKSAFAIGGTHYLATLNKFQLNSDIAIGHTCPKHMLTSLDKEMILQAMEKTVPRPEFVVLDWKGLGTEKQRIVSLLEELKIEFKRSDKI